MENNNVEFAYSCFEEASGKKTYLILKAKYSPNLVGRTFNEKEFQLAWRENFFEGRKRYSLVVEK